MSPRSTRDARERPTAKRSCPHGKRDATAHGGHLLSASVRPTMEIVITDTPTQLRKRHDAESGLALISTT